MRWGAYAWSVLFVLATLGVVALIVAALLLVGHFSKATAADLLDWHPTRSPLLEAQNEVDDVRQMLEAQNEMRRRRGAPEMIEEDLAAAVREDERVRLRGRGPFRGT